MEHVAIMRKSWGLLKKIAEGNKKIESRWYKTKYAPWGKIHEGDVVYFKDSGEPVTLKSRVDRVEFFSNLGPETTEKILLEYGPEDGLGLDDIDDFYQRVKDKKYCILIFLSDVENVDPFTIDKSGFGAMSAWITVKNVETIRNDSEKKSGHQKQIIEYFSQNE